MNYYDILEVNQNASPEVIKAAYRSLAQKYHPDKNSSLEATEKMKDINSAYEVLSNPVKRKGYDEAINKIISQQNKPAQPKTDKPKETPAKKPDFSKPSQPQNDFSNFKEIKVDPILQQKIQYQNFLRTSIIKDKDIMLNFLNTGYSLKAIYKQYIPDQDKKHISFKEFEKLMKQFFIMRKPINVGNRKFHILIAICLAAYAYANFNTIEQYTKQYLSLATNQFKKESSEDLYSKGLTAYKSKNTNEALKWLTLASEKGHIPSINLLGQIYIENKNYELAMKWFNESAEKGDDFGQFSLGLLYANGQGTQQNYELAAKWYALSANQGNNYAQNNLGNLLEMGLGVSKNIPEAINLYIASANQNNVIAQYNLAERYLNGNGVKEDKQEAKRLYKLAANQGLEVAKKKLKQLEN